MICRTDVGGAYRRESTATEWTQIISSDYMTIPAPASPLGLGNNYGVYEAKIAPSDPSRAYMFFRGRCMKSSDRGVTWVDDGLNGSTGLTFNANGGAVRLRPDKFAIDKVNAEVAYFGSPANGLWRRLNGSWSQNSSIPVATTAVQAILIGINPLSSNTGSGATLRKSEVFVSVNGSGIYRSTDGGSSFALMTGHPGAGSTYAANCMIVDQTGKLWLCLDNTLSQNVWTYSGGTWTQVVMPTGNVRFLAVDPKNSSRIVGCVGGGSQPFTSTNGGATWASGFQPTNQWATANTVPLIASVLQSTFAASQSAAAAQFLPHPIENRDYIAMGLGVCYFDSPWAPKGSRTLVWKEDSAGIEELVARTALITPNGDTICGSWDKAVIRQADSGYATGCYPPYALTEGYSIDYGIDNGDYLAALAIKGGNRSGYSTDGGATWTQFAASPTTRQGGSLAVGNQGNVVYFPGQNGQPKYTTDNGLTWSTPTFTGWTLPADGTGNGFQFGSTEQYRQIVCADKNNAGTFYCYNQGAAAKGIWKSVNNGATWTRIYSASPIADVYSGYHVHLKMAPNGDMFLCTGSVNTVFDNTTAALMAKSTDGGLTWANVPHLSEVNVFAIGEAAPDSSTPYTLHAIAWKAGVFGLYRSIDGGANWTLLHNNPHFDDAQAMAADPNEFGRLIVGYTGTGFYETTYDYTLTLKAA